MDNEILSNLLNAEIDKILSSDSVEMPEKSPEKQECQELLKLAVTLAQVDFTPSRKKSFAEFAVQIQDKNNEELNDDDLDLVAGGVDPKWLIEKKKGRK